MHSNPGALHAFWGHEGALVPLVCLNRHAIMHCILQFLSPCCVGLNSGSKKFESCRYRGRYALFKANGSSHGMRLGCCHANGGPLFDHVVPGTFFVVELEYQTPVNLDVEPWYKLPLLVSEPLS